MMRYVRDLLLFALNCIKKKRDHRLHRIISIWIKCLDKLGSGVSRSGFSCNLDVEDQLVAPHAELRLKHDSELLLCDRLCPATVRPLDPLQGLKNTGETTTQSLLIDHNYKNATTF